MNKREEANRMRAQGYTLREIAEVLGCSRQYVCALTGKQDVRLFRRVSEKVCIYPNMRNWMNENKVNKAELLRRMGFAVAHGNHEKLRNILNGKLNPKKTWIDRLIEVTNLPYEVLFAE